MVLGRGCGTPSMTARSRYPKDVYELGRGYKNNEKCPDIICQSEKAG